MNKIEDFGVHCKSYYSLETSIFKSQTDNLLLKTLWNKYWASTLSSSTLKTYVLKKSIITKNNLFRFNNNGFRNEDYITEQIKDISGKLEHVSDQVRYLRSVYRLHLLHFLRRLVEVVETGESDLMKVEILKMMTV